jgi:hypothetical protein
VVVGAKVGAVALGMVRAGVVGSGMGRCWMQHRDSAHDDAKHSAHGNADKLPHGTALVVPNALPHVLADERPDI